MNLSDATVKKILIGVAAFVVLVFILVKIWRRSFYSYPNTSEDARVSVTGLANSGTGAGAVVTVTTGAPHNFKVNDIILLANSGVTVTTATVTTTVTGLTGTPVIVTGTPTATSFTFAGSVSSTTPAAGATAENVGYGVMTGLKSNLVACQDAYGRAIINGTATADAQATRTTCIRDAVSPYTRGHCQWLPQLNPDGTTTITNPASGPEKAAFDTYQQDIKNVQLAYVSAANRAAAGTFTGLTGTAANITKAGELVSAARAADITGATRKYLAAVCPGFYVSGDGTTDPSSQYVTWTSEKAAAAPARGFWTNNSTAQTMNSVTDNDILTWAQYAGNVTFVTGTGLSSSGGLLSGLTISGYSDKSGLGGTNSENWRKAYETGPATYPKVTYA